MPVRKTFSGEKVFHFMLKSNCPKLGLEIDATFGQAALACVFVPQLILWISFPVPVHQTGAVSEFYCRPYASRGRFVRARTSVLVTLTCQLIPIILRRQRRWNTFSLFSCPEYSVQVSEP